MKCRRTQHGYIGFIILAVIAGVLIIWAWLGSRQDSNMSELDKIKLTLEIAQASDCYFDQVTVKRNAQGDITQVHIQQDGQIIHAKAVEFPQFKNQVFHLPSAQLMYCTQGTYNFKSPYLLIHQSLSELSADVRAEKMQAIKKDLLFKKIEKQHSYFSF